MIQTSDTITKLFGAIQAVQKAVDHVDKGAINPHFGNSYADLNTFLKALHGPLADNGLVITQAPGMADGWVTVDTMLVHNSGEWLRATAGSPLPKSDPQGAGSATTYLRRYSLAALFMLPQEDDDGNAASPAPRREEPRYEHPQKPEQQTGYGTPSCPKCGGAMWDNRSKKASGDFNPKAPDFKCKDKGCDTPIWFDAKEQRREPVPSGDLNEPADDMPF